MLHPYPLIYHHRFQRQTPHRGVQQARWARTCAALLVLFLGCLTGAEAGNGPALTNVIIGGAERRCSSFTGSGQGRDCTANWDTILAQDPAFQGLSKDDISFEVEPVLPVFTYSLTAERLAALEAIPSVLFDSHRKIQLLQHLSESLANAPMPTKNVAWQAVELLLPTTLLQPGTTQLTPAEVAMLRSALVDPVAPAARKLQGRSTLFSSNAASREIFDRFVAAARAVNSGKKPLIGVVTASAGLHPFADRDINVFALTSAGADVVYLPLDGGFRQALDAHDCEQVRYYYDSYANTNPERPVHHAHLQFPDLSAQQKAYCANQGALLNATLERINGIYFSGGNQARHLESLVGKDGDGHYTVATAQLRILQRRHAQGQLVVAGTSAGNHIQGGGMWRGKPVPMIGGGGAYDVLKSGFAVGRGPAAEPPERSTSGPVTTYAPVMYPLGGLGVFRFGLLDSHFSKRAREARLIRAVHDSGMDYGFGVDENTALLVHRPDAAGNTRFSVVGEGGVFIADLRQARGSADVRGPLVIEKARLHYLLPGDQASVDAAGGLQVTLWAEGEVLPVIERQPPVTQDKLLDYGSSNFLRLTTAMGLSGAIQAWGTTHNSADRHSQQSAPVYRATLTRDEYTVFRAHKANVGTTGDRVSYTGLRVALAPLETQSSPTSAIQTHTSPHERN